MHLFLLVPGFCSPRRYQNETKIALPLGQSEAHLACALLFVPPMIPSCDVKAAIQHRAKGNSWPLCISSLYKPLFLRHPECSVWQSCAFHAWVTWLNGGNQMLFPEWSPRQTSPHPTPPTPARRLKFRPHGFQGLNGWAQASVLSAPVQPLRQEYH